MALVNSLNMYSLSSFGFANGIFSFDQLYIGSESRIAYLSLPSSLEEPSTCGKVIDSSICLEKYHSYISSKVSLGSEEHFFHIQILSENLNSFYFLPYFIKTLNPTMFLSSFLTWKALFSGRYHTWRCHVIFLFYNVFLNLFLGNLLTSERN